MNQQQIFENNQIIERFLGSNIININDFVCPTDVEENQKLCFNWLWDWLMPVVDVINDQIQFNEAHQHLLDNVHNAILRVSLEETYQEVLNYIKAYNKLHS